MNLLIDPALPATIVIVAAIIAIPALMVARPRPRTPPVEPWPRS